MGSDVSSIETAIGARDWALAAMGQVATSRSWSAREIAAGGAILAGAAQGIDTSADYWARVVRAWDATIAASTQLPAGWEKLADVWRSAAAARVSGMSEEDLSSWWTQVSGAYDASKADLSAAASEGADALAWVKAHPFATLGLVLGAAAIYQSLPLVLAALVRR